MTSCATVRPPMPESNTPTGAELRHHHLSDAVIAVPPPCGSRRSREARGNVPQVRGDERVGAGEQMIGDEQRDPVLDVRLARVNVRIVECAARVFGDGGVARSGRRTRRRWSRPPMRRASCTSAADSRIMTRLIASTSMNAARRLVAAEHALRVAGERETNRETRARARSAA